MVSVIIPNYNHAKYLEQRIESVLNQTFQDFEVLLFDDNSTDNSREVIEKYRGHEKISHIIYNEQNSGSTFKQWDKGFALAKGEYIWIAESDDIAELDFLEVGMSKLTEGVGMFCSNAVLIDSNNAIISNSYHHNCYLSILENGFKVWNGIDFVKENMLLFNTICNASGVLFDKKLLKGVSDDYKSYKLTGDWLFWAQLAKNTRLVLSRKGYNKFRCHSNNVRSSVKEQLLVNETYSAIDFLCSDFQIQNKNQVYNKVFNHFTLTLSNINIMDIDMLKSFDKNIAIRVLKYKLDFFLVNNRIFHSIRKMGFFFIAIKNKVIK